MARTIVIANQKGGVGKTTTAISLAASLAVLGKRVLLVDMDPQGNASSGVGLDKYNLPLTVYDALVDESVTSQACYETPACENLWLMASNRELVGAEIELVNMSEREFRLKHVLEQVKASFDFIVVDCPPSLGLLTLNCLATADSVLIPLQCEYYALEGLSSLLETLVMVQESINPTLRVEGILLTMYQHTNLARDVVLDVKNQFIVSEDAAPVPGDSFIARVRSHLGPRVFETVIPRNVALSEAPSHGVPIHQYDPRSQGSRAYMALAQEVLNRGESS
jgi:chromosome partitioning protein